MTLWLEFAANGWIPQSNGPTEFWMSRIHLLCNLQWPWEWLSAYRSWGKCCQSPWCCSRWSILFPCIYCTLPQECIDFLLHQGSGRGSCSKHDQLYQLFTSRDHDQLVIIWSRALNMAKPMNPYYWVTIGQLANTLWTNMSKSKHQHWCWDPAAWKARKSTSPFST